MRILDFATDPQSVLPAAVRKVHADEPGEEQAHRVPGRRASRGAGGAGSANKASAPTAIRVATLAKTVTFWTVAPYLTPTILLNTSPEIRTVPMISVQTPSSPEPVIAKPRWFAQMIAMIAVHAALDRGGVAEDEQEPAERSVGVAQDFVLAAATGVHRAELGEAQSAEHRDHTADEPGDHR